MVEADSGLKLLPTPKLDIFNLFEHIDMLSMGIWQYPQIVKPTLLGSDFGSLVESKWCHYIMVEADIHLKLLPASYMQRDSADSYAVHVYEVAASNSYTHITWVRFEGSGSLVESKWCHYIMVKANIQLKNASIIHTTHSQSIRAHLYAVHGHMAVASNSYTHTTWVTFMVSGSLSEWKWCHYVMVETDSHFKLIPLSTSDTYKVFLQIHMLHPWA